jgi:hypothetical protein
MPPPFRPTKPPTTLFDPVLVTAPEAVDSVMYPRPLVKLSAPMRPPSTLLPPPVTAPLAELEAMMPSPAPTKPPATLVSPTLTLPLACEPKMNGRLKNICPSPIRQPLQLKLLVECDPTRPPATLLLPACTLPVASDATIQPELSPTSPPTCRFATFGPPTLPLACESKIRP